MKRVVLFFADGTEEVEALTAVDLLRRAGAHVIIAGVGTKTPVGSHGICITADATEEEVQALCPDMVVLPGGMPGTNALDASETVDRMLRTVYDGGGILAAICAAPMVLGKRGYLAGRQAICYPGFENTLTGAVISDQKVCRDGNIITAAGAGVAMDFALLLVKALFGAEKAAALRASVLA